ANTRPYADKKRSSPRKPLYAVWKPPTSSLSAAAKSNGARLQLAVAHVKYVQNAANVKGSWNKYQLHKKPVCCRQMALKFIVPATMTGTTTQMAIGTS